MSMMFRLASTIAAVLVVIFSFYMIRKTRGRMVGSFKMMLIGHTPVALVYVAELLLTFYGIYEEGDLRVVFIEQTAQVVAALSVFLAIYLIKRNIFISKGDSGNGKR